MLRRMRRRWIIGAIFLLIMLLIGRPLVFLSYHYIKDHRVLPSKSRPGYPDDASHMNETKMDSIVLVDPMPDKAEKQLQDLVSSAARSHRVISIGGARHSMGGQTLYSGGILVDMRGYNQMHLDPGNNVLSVGSGALWSEVVPYLNKYGKSVLIMQTNNSFSVGGSLSVNCHGWQVGAGPIASSVLSFRLLMADGKICTCSRSENQQLFSLIPGGYGLFGIILDVKLKVTDNKTYRMYQYVMPSEDYLKAFRERVDHHPRIGMVYGRINVNQDHFVHEAILSTFQIDDSVAAPALKAPGLSAFRRTVFRSSASSEYGKALRWRLEKLVAKLGKGKIFSRNQLMNEPVDIFQNSEPGYADILHEYFIPADSINRFIDEIRTTIPKYKVDLMNITIRNVLEDRDAYMCYARKEVFGFVMLFNEAIDPGADRDMRDLTQKLVDIAISLGGTYYLPYRLHATREQFYRAYPMAQEFFKLKRKYDPEEIFQNQFYKTYK